MQKMTGFQQEGLLLHHIMQDVPIAGQFMNHHHQNEYEICVVQKGKGSFIVEGIEHPIKDRTVFFFKHLENHMASIEFPNMYDRFTVIFSKNSIDGDSLPMSLLLATLNNKPSGKFNYFTDEDINFDLITACLRNMMDPDFYNLKVTITAHLYPVLYELCKAYTKLDPNAAKIECYPELFSQVLDYIKVHYAENITLDFLTNHFYISKSTLHRMFKKYTNTTFYQYLTRVRMLEAKELVKETDLSFSQISQQCGFSDYSAFYRLYKSFFMMSPQADRKGSLFNNN